MSHNFDINCSKFNLILASQIVEFEKHFISEDLTLR
jgi:hypothetical protein